MSWASEYVGIPYEPSGRTRAGIDCWGLARLVWSEKFGRQLPDFEYAGDTARAVRDYAPRVETIAVTRPQEGDLALIRQRGRVRHVGIYAGSGQVLHVLDGGVVIERADSARLRSTITEWRRPA